MKSVCQRRKKEVKRKKDDRRKECKAERIMKRRQSDDVMNTVLGREGRITGEERMYLVHPVGDGVAGVQLDGGENSLPGGSGGHQGSGSRVGKGGQTGVG